MLKPLYVLLFTLLLFSACTPKIDTDAYITLEDVQGSWYIFDTIYAGGSYGDQYSELHIIKDRIIFQTGIVFSSGGPFCTNRVVIDSGDTWYKVSDSRHFPSELMCFTRSKKGNPVIHGFFFEPWELRPLPEDAVSHLEVLNTFGYKDLGDAYKNLPNYRTHQILADSLESNYKRRHLTYIGHIDSITAQKESFSMLTEDSISQEHPYYFHYDTLRRALLNEPFKMRHTGRVNMLLHKIDNRERNLCERKNVPVRNKLKGDRWSQLLLAPRVEIEEED